MPTLYQVLGVARDASTTDIEGAFRDKLAELKAHPNLNAQAMDELREAYRVLANPGRRSDYDETLPLTAAERTAAMRAARDAARHAARAAAPQAAGAAVHAENPFADLLASPLVKWLVPVLVLIALGMWWKSGRPKPAPKAPDVRVVSQTTTSVDHTAPSAGGGRAAVDVASLATAPPSMVGSAEEVFSGVSGSVARVRVSDGLGNPVGQGSGVVIASGSVITNCHVTAMGERISVKVGGEEYAATVGQSDEGRDLCRLDVPGLSALSVPLASVVSLRVGQRVYAVGAPHGLELTLSEGIVSSLRETPDGTVIQTTAPISPGSSGGGLFDAGGRMVGVVTFQHKFGQNLNFAIPADWIHQMGARSR